VTAVGRDLEPLDRPESGTRRAVRLGGRAVAWVLMTFVRAYQILISPLLPPSCRYFPSCSAYALEALDRHGPIKGSWLAARRIGRCHPFRPGGYDPVP
jgi:uncharacterized protein